MVAMRTQIHRAVSLSLIQEERLSFEPCEKFHRFCARKSYEPSANWPRKLLQTTTPTKSVRSSRLRPLLRETGDYLDRARWAHHDAMGATAYIQEIAYNV